MTKKLTRLIGDIHGLVNEYTAYAIDKFDGPTIQIGDFGIGFGQGEYWLEYVSEFHKRGGHRFIRGNHDPKVAKFEALFESVKNQATFRRENGGERVVLCHYPLRAWRGQLSGAMHLYGHTHGALQEVGRSMDVGVDSWNYSPVRLSHALDVLAARPVMRPGGWVRRQDMRHDVAADLPT